MWKAKARDKTGVCQICGRRLPTEIHHVFEGNGRRKISDEWDAVIEVCRSCHHDIEYRPKKYEWLKQKYQREIMVRNGLSMEEWIARIGRNYL